MIKRTLFIPKNKEECANMSSCSDCDMFLYDDCREILDLFTELFEEK